MTESSEYGQQQRGPSFISIFIAVVLVGILVAMVAGLLMLRSAGQKAEEKVERVLDWSQELVKEPTPVIRLDSATIVHEIQTFSRLETVSYSVEKVVTVEKNQQGLADILQLDEKLLFVAHGQVIAGVDLSKMQEEDISISDDNTVILALPPAEVFVTTLDNDLSYVYDHERGIVNRLLEGQSELETLARQAAEAAIEEAALEDGVLELATTNAQNYLRAFLTALDFDQVLFTNAPVRTPTPE